VVHLDIKEGNCQWGADHEAGEPLSLHREKNDEKIESFFREGKKRETRQIISGAIGKEPACLDHGIGGKR